ncbi:transcription termination factor NusA [Granulicella mallensis]|uniref:Transcription termination/antitermination protein NusA n=1 Tax=Granulicella mallensis TaxID=940614 RepID=A0A7W8EA56_9BACT|nr:transcription termination factor NusA [Granulicella mallensis]MBB5065253.1 N utilization substance protein A [Granulicella mallensis]
MASPLYQSIELLSREKGIDPEIVVGAVEDAIALATRKYYKTVENMRGEMDRETGEIRAYVFKTVVETPELVEDADNQLALEQARELAPEVEVGGELRFYKDTTPLGRIAAQMAKQVIFQKVREAERDTVFNEYAHRAGEILTATVKRLEPMDVIFDLGKAEARMPKREQSRLEQFSVAERVRVVLLRVDRAAKGPQVIVSRAAPALVQSLFQSEVPEIYDGTVSIRAIAREAGERTKIAVVSRDKDVDPVGACVGMKGMRVQSIIRELRGEKIDIIEYSEEITTFAEKALQPAKVSRVSITDLAEKQLEVIVDDTQLSLAIGKKGQNVRLAAKLLQWKIDIKSEEEKRQEVEQQMQAMTGGPSTPIEQVTELGESVMEKLIAAGITTVESLADMTAEELGEVPGIGDKTVEKIAVAVRHYFGQYEEGEERPVPAPVEPALVAGEEAVAAAAASDEAGDTIHSMSQTPEEILAAEASDNGGAEEINEFSTEDIANLEDEISDSDANDANDAREEGIELDNDTVDELVDQAQEFSDEGIDDGRDRG